MLNALRIILLLIASPLVLSAQVPDSVIQKAIAYSAGSASPVLYVHFDKTMYANNETVWFTGYLLNANDPAMYNTMSIALVNDIDRTVVFESRCVMNKGIAFGKALIPDAAPPGNYTIIAITNLLKNQQPDVIFKAPVTIRSANQPEFVATLNPVDTSVNLSQQKVRLNVTYNDLPIPAKKGAVQRELQINYYVGDASHPAIKGFGKTKGGSYDFSIPSASLTEGNNKLVAQLWYQDKATELSINLPARKLPPVITFHPEGGRLVNNLQNRVGWQAKTAAGAPLSVTAFLYKNNIVIDTINTDLNGAGVFDLTPVQGASYSLKLYRHENAAYTLPAGLDNGTVLSLKNALANDTLVVSIKSQQNQKVYLIGHNYSEVFFNTAVTLHVGYKNLALILNEVPAGVSQLMLLDSAGRRLSERLFFSHYNKRPVVSIATDKPQYTTRQKVTARIMLNSADVEPAEVSVAGVQSNRVMANGASNIAEYFYWTNKLPGVSIPAGPLYQSKAAREMLETQLLVNEWGSHKDNDSIAIIPTGLAPQYTDMAFTGRVTYLGKPVTNPVTIFNTANPTQLIATDNTGKFALTHDDIKTDSANQVNFIVSGDDAKNYGLYLSDAYSNNNQLLATRLEPLRVNNAPGNTQYLFLPDKERTIKLNEVTIKAQKDDQFYGTLGQVGTAAQTGTSTESSLRNADGTVTHFTHVFIMQAQKQKYLLAVNGILQTAPQFKVNTQWGAEPQYLSTLFWKPHQHLLPGKEAEVTFDTGDITGDFKIIVQGKTATGAVYGEALFNVIK